MAHFDDSGGIFEGGEVTYRGVKVGRVGKLELTDDGVDVHLDVENSFDDIPADSLAVVGNRSAVGEQYVELQPQVDTAPYLRNDSEIAVEDTRTPIPTQKLLADISNTVSSVDQEALATTVDELGQAFAGTGEDLQQIIDTGNSFIEEANANFDVTTALIRDSNTVLSTQVRSASAIRNFASQLSLFSSSLAGSDPALRQVIEDGSAAATELRDLPRGQRGRPRRADQQPGHHRRGDRRAPARRPADPGDLPLRRRGRLHGRLQVARHRPLRRPLRPDPDHNPVCHAGYQGTDTRPPQDGSNRPMNENARCTEPPTMSNARGAQNLGRTGAAYRAPVASYDPDTGRLRWGSQIDPTLAQPGTLAPQTFGEDSWKWLFLQPLTNIQR